jgi:hypothetical protein
LYSSVQVVEIGNVPLDVSHIAADLGHGLIQFRHPAAEYFSETLFACPDAAYGAR